MAPLSLKCHILGAWLLLSSKHCFISCLWLLYYLKCPIQEAWLQLSCKYWLMSWLWLLYSLKCPILGAWLLLSCKYWLMSWLWLLYSLNCSILGAWVLLSCRYCLILALAAFLLSWTCHLATSAFAIQGGFCSFANIALALALYLLSWTCHLLASASKTQHCLSYHANIALCSSFDSYYLKCPIQKAWLQLSCKYCLIFLLWLLFCYHEPVQYNMTSVLFALFPSFRSFSPQMSHTRSMASVLLHILPLSLQALVPILGVIIQKIAYTVQHGICSHANIAVLLP